MTQTLPHADVPKEDSIDGRAALIREATAVRHKEAENRSFITALMGGELTIEDYTRYLAQFAYVYRALEDRTAQPDDPALIVDPRLNRYAAMVADLEALGAADWEASHPPLAATQAYVDRLTEIVGDVPRYLAHHYTRYLGDLSGGQAIAKLVARHYGATEDQLAFYRFEGIDSPVIFKRAYREALDNLEFSAEQDSALVAEACAAFDFNSAVFEGLDQATARVVA